MAIIIFTLIVLLFSTIIHEISHGSVAYYLGDPTAKYSGRLTLNPLKHLDPFGSILLPLFLLVFSRGQGPIFGWAKPVPVNPYNFKDQRWGGLKVAIAGPAVNFLIGIIFSLLGRFSFLPQPLLSLLAIISIYNFAWGIFNLIPVPPLDGSWILFAFLKERQNGLKIFLEQYGFLLLLLLIFSGLHWVFNAAVFLYYLFG